VSTSQRSTAAPRRGGLGPVALAALGAWAMAVPYLGPPIGLTLEVPAGVEFADHVVPGLFVAAASLPFIVLERSGRVEGLLSLTMAGLAFLAGFWMVATHVPLLLEALAGVTGWAPTVWHAHPGAANSLLALWLLVAPTGPRPEMPG